jgi:hypothetical protein
VAVLTESADLESSGLSHVTWPTWGNVRMSVRSGRFADERFPVPVMTLPGPPHGNQVQYKSRRGASIVGVRGVRREG